MKIADLKCKYLLFETLVYIVRRAKWVFRLSNTDRPIEVVQNTHYVDDFISLHFKSQPFGVYCGLAVIYCRLLFIIMRFVRSTLRFTKNFIEN